MAAAELGWKAQYHMADVISLMLDAQIASLRGGGDNEFHLVPELRSR